LHLTAKWSRLSDHLLFTQKEQQMTKDPNVISHWHQLIENFETPSLGFYDSLEAAVTMRAIPETSRMRIEHKEGSLASAKRAYLRLHRGKYAFDICAAPFGTGFFVSWWLTEPPLSFALLYTLAFVFAVLIAMYIAFGIGTAIGAVLHGFGFGIFLGGSAAFLGAPAVLWLLGHAIRRGVIRGESTVLAMPLIGALYERVFAPTTFYAFDTALMFRDAVHNAVLEVLDGLTAKKGIRALSEDERKPILKKFTASV
jgi:hypothetical protein